MSSRTVKISKFLSLVLRHEPGRIGIQLDSAGWVDVDELLRACTAHQFPFSRDELNQVVATNDKKRFAFSEDGKRIRANQGHSVEVELQYEPSVPPEILYHGTADRFLASIQQDGLIKGNRHHVHLSTELSTAISVGQRHGRPLVFRVLAGQMHRSGHQFFVSANGVWLADHIPANFLQIHTGEQ
ncbi:RNA 2'-phosphotransferase [Pedosphaera parvula]|uniref:Probable RNA 2'-phosphotransferase n=1 Tax=Pedosphaera parvula (strain Ellin514) TaxID=320771 RepID=B9XNA4_PEDPL|nr:RNA 2'-phosphotransferase [Pedosphaera parvula]EEF58657.1 Phosphate acetyltransferase [Pedosphaera parvula Ellin514]